MGSGRPVFTREDGSALHPASVTARFERLVRDADLPPIRLHDLRQGAATLARAGSANLKVVSEMLGHSSISITADTYTSVLPEVAREAAEAAARLVPRKTPTSGYVPISSPPSPQDDTGLSPRRKKAQVRWGGVRRQGLEPRTRGLRAWLAGVHEHPRRCIVAVQRPCVDTRGPARLRLNQPNLQPRWHPRSAPRRGVGPSIACRKSLCDLSREPIPGPCRGHGRG